MTLVLHDTDFEFLHGDGPALVELKGVRTMIGRGSQTIHVDAEITARKNGNDIISRRHAEIVRLNDGSYQIQDLGALNGTFVNSERITKKILFNNDIVQFGGLSARPKGEDQWSV